MGRLVGSLWPVLYFLAALSLLVSGWSGWGKMRRRPGAVKHHDVSRETSHPRNCRCSHCWLEVRR